LQLFKRLKHEVPKYHHKVSGVAGDCSLPGLGLSVSSRETLINEVNVIFHGAATVRFDEHIRVAVNINLQGTRELLNIARKITNLKVKRKNTRTISMYWIRRTVRCTVTGGEEGGRINRKYL